MLYWIQTFIAALTCFRTFWGLLRDIKRQDVGFRPVHWASRTKRAVKHYRRTGANLPEVLAYSKYLGEKVADLKAKQNLKSHSGTSTLAMSNGSTK
jgi:hypothetical protein